MNVFEKIKSKNIDELAEWIDKHCDFDSAPWWKWWDENYCDKCEPVETDSVNYFGRTLEHSYCELSGNCRFFKELDDIPDSKQVIKLWLESETNNKEQECTDCRYFVSCEGACGGKVCDIFVKAE